LEIIVNCPICKHDAFNRITINSKFGITSVVIKCNNCSLVFLEKQLDDDEVLKFYHDSYRVIKRERFDEIRYLGDLERAISQFNFFKDFVKLDDEIIDIGAGWGINANYLFLKGYENIVVNELDDKVEQQLDPRIVRKSELIGSVGGKYDFIIMSHTLEHLFDLQGKVSSLFNMLNDGGKLFIEVPNSKNNKIVDGCSESYHYWYFMMTHLFLLADNNGFNVLKYGVFGKKQFICDMDSNVFSNWKRGISEDDLSSIVELPEYHENAYWLRVLFER